MTDPEIVRAPWTWDQVDSLNAFQWSGVAHPFTCGDDACREKNQRHPLLATRSGWSCLYCRYRQDWAYAGMADWGWRASPLRRETLGAGEEGILTNLKTLACSVEPAWERGPHDRAKNAQLVGELRRYCDLLLRGYAAIDGTKGER